MGRVFIYSDWSGGFGSMQVKLAACLFNRLQVFNVSEQCRIIMKIVY